MSTQLHLRGGEKERKKRRERQQREQKVPNTGKAHAYAALQGKLFLKLAV